MTTQTQSPIFNLRVGNSEVFVTVNIDATTARRRVSGWCGGYVATTCGGGLPELVVKDDKAFWRVPIVFTVVGKGVVGEIGAVIVDAQTNELIDASEEVASTMRTNASAMYQRLKAEGHTFTVKIVPDGMEANHA